MSLKQPVWHVLVLSVLTFKLYLIYWCYKNWRDLAKQFAESNAEEKPAASWITKMGPAHLSSFKDSSPHLRGILTALFSLQPFVPFLQDYLIFTLVYGVCKIYPDRDSFIARMPAVAAVTVVAVSGMLSYLALLNGVSYLLFFLSVIPIIAVQHLINKYWETVEKSGLLVRHGFSLKELIVIILGALALGFIVVGMFLVPESAR